MKQLLRFSFSHKRRIRLYNFNSDPGTLPGNSGTELNLDSEFSISEGLFQVPVQSTPATSFVVSADELPDISDIVSDALAQPLTVPIVGGNNRSLVVIKNLPNKLVNCNRLYNFLWQYGCVENIAFINTENELGITANIVVSDIQDAERIVVNLEAGPIYGIRVNAFIKPFQHTDFEPSFELEDGSKSSKAFPTEIATSSENCSIPSKALQFVISAPVTPGEIQLALEKSTTVKIVKILFDKDDESQGIINFLSLDDATETLVLCHRKVLKGDCQIVLRYTVSNEEMQTSTVHTNPNWLKDLKKNFKQEIIFKCSLRTRNAVEEDEYIGNDYEHRKVKAEIIDCIMRQVKSIFGGVGKPTIEQWREVAIQLGFAYPSMFRDMGEIEGRRKIDDIKRLGQKLCDTYRERAHREKKKLASNSGEVPEKHEIPKRRKKVYGGFSFDFGFF